MSVSSSVKQLQAATGRKNRDLMTDLNISTRQALYNKFTRGSWSGNDLAKVASSCGCLLAFLLPNGERILIEADTRLKGEGKPDSGAW